MSVNTDLSPSFLLPGIFGQLDLRQGAVMLGGYSKSVIVVGYKSSAGLAQLNSPTVLSNDADIAAQVGTDSDLAEDVRACFSVPGVRGVVLSVDLVLTVEARPVLEVVAPPVAAAGKR
jgi:phage tail sheath gpL-like